MGTRATILVLVSAACSGLLDEDPALSDDDLRQCGSRRRCDRTPPTVSIEAPADGAEVNGRITVSGVASDNREVAVVEVSLDDEPWRAATGTTSWSATVDLGAAASGEHTLQARARDATGNSATDGVVVIVGDGGGTEPPPPPPPTGSCTLTGSGPIAASHDGQVIENLRITSTSGPALRVSGFANVTIRKVQIFHSGGAGIEFDDATNLHIEDVEITNTGAPASGPNPSDGWNNIDGIFTTGLVITRARLVRGSSGVYLIESPGARLSFIEGHDFRGPFPRGQVVQFDKSPNSVLEDFSSENGATSWTEDNVSVYHSANVTIRRGLVDGNNSPSGVGIMFELSDGSTGGLAEDIDAVHQGNGCFSAYPGANVTFNRTRARDNICTSQGRGAPLSNALVWAGSPESSGLRILDSSYWALCNDNLVWDESTFSTVDITEEAFTARPPLRLSFCFVP